MTSQEVALQVIQQAICVLAGWAEATLPDGCQLSKEHPAVTKGKELLSWHDNTQISYLELLFDAVKFPDSKHRDFKPRYCPANALEASDDCYPSIPYPLTEPPDLEAYKTIVKQELENLREQDWQNLSLLTLILEKYGSCLSFCEGDIALIDIVRSTAAVASALVNNPEAQAISLIAGDLSGIQNFIYTISSDGALKSLRARSFYLELVAEEIVQQLLEELNLPRTSVIYSGGGNLYLLAPVTEDTEKAVETVKSTFNQWLKDEFQCKIFLGLASESFPVVNVSNKSFAGNWDNVIKKVNKQKSQKFVDQIDNLLTPKVSYEQRCRVCHRDDTEDLKQLNKHEDDSVIACLTCRAMFELGGKLLGVKAIIRSSLEQIEGKVYTIHFRFGRGNNIYYHIFPKWKQIIKDAGTALLVNDWEIEHYQFCHFDKATPLLLGNYAAKSIDDDNQTIRGEELAELAEGIKRIGYLRMDVDNLGKIFAKGLGNKHSLPRLAGLSRQMSYFFKVYLNSLADNRNTNLFTEAQHNAESLTESSRENLVFIYAGGDDLFVSGAWNEIVEFAFDVYQSFRAYTGYNRDITLSGGISINDIKFPLYQSADESGESEKVAKGNGRDSLGLFGEVFKWDEWLGRNETEVINAEIQNYLSIEQKPSLFGVLPFVKKLYTVDKNYSRSFVRNLLATAQIQNQMIKEIEDKRKKLQYEGQDRDIRYYLHLPKIAYTLARLPKKVLDDDEFRKSLKSPYNAPYFQAIAIWIELLTRK
ncbi:MAG: type III-A CRISPR-associated protein Cas10/Csm1 [Microcoleus sp. CAN_BIN18]|nr:type III-A CRISPR-associated protein Cas10/Csm1 [Microcoleus sp. CAN_BIN18]